MGMINMSKIVLYTYVCMQIYIVTFGGVTYNIRDFGVSLYSIKVCIM